MTTKTIIDPAPGLTRNARGRTTFRGPVVHLTAEYWPYARTGGLAEAVRGIARFQAATGVPTVVLMPLHGGVRARVPCIEPLSDPFEVNVGPNTFTTRILHDPTTRQGPHVHFLEDESHFGRPGIYGEDGGSYPDNHRRFAVFCRAALDALPRLSSEPPVIHAHDWHTALAPLYLRTLFAGEPFYEDVSSVLTVHNAGYQGQYGREVLPELGIPEDLFGPESLEWYGQANLLKGGMAFSDVVTTVSPTHAHELRTRTGGFGLHETFNALSDRFAGILNGIDYEVWDPRTDPHIEANYSRADLSGKDACKAWIQEAGELTPDPGVPLFGMSARMVEQKGLDIILAADMIPRLDAQWIFLGQGEPRYEEALARLAERAPDRVSVRFDFTEEREHKLMAGADFLLMPSLYEPCGLTQMRSQRYGALPVVRRVGGLADTVEDRITGFVFDEYQPWALEEAVRSAIDLYKDRKVWRWHVREAMGRDFGWAVSAERYKVAYRRAVDHRHGLD